jgi:transposase
MIALGTHQCLAFALSGGNAHDAPQGRTLLEQISLSKGMHVVMDKGYADFKTRNLVQSKACVPVVPPKSNMLKPWRYNKQLYKRRNEIERLFHHLKNFRRIATRYDKLDVVFSSFVVLGLIMLLLRLC